MADRIVLNTISYHGHGAIENIVPELTARGYKKAFVCSEDVYKRQLLHLPALETKLDALTARILQNIVGSKE